MAINKNSFLLDEMSKRNKIIENNDSLTKSAVLLLENPSDNVEEIRILRTIGLDKHIRKVETRKNDIQRVEILKKKYNRNIFTGKELKTLCVNQGLLLRRADTYEGEIPLELSIALLDFVKENKRIVETEDGRKRDLSDLHLSESSFFILSTKKSFNGKKIESATLFYRDTESKNHNYDTAREEDIFVQIESWGDNFKTTWRFLDFISSNDSMSFNLLVTMILSVVFTIMGFLKDWNINYLLTIAIMLSFFTTMLSSSDQYFRKWN